MRRKVVATVLAAAALSAAPLAAPPAHADHRRMCDRFWEPYEEPCSTVQSSAFCIPGLLLAPCTW